MKTSTKTSAPDTLPAPQGSTCPKGYRRMMLGIMNPRYVREDLVNTYLDAMDRD